MTFLSTRTGQIFPTSERDFQALIPTSTMPMLFQTCMSATLSNGDTCKLESWVLASGSDHVLFPCQITEILQCIGSPNQRHAQPDVFLVQYGRNHGPVHPYEMPQISLTHQYLLIDPHVRAFSLYISQTYMIF